MTKLVTIYAKEISYGFVEIEVDDNTTEDELYEKANELYGNGCFNWNNTQFSVTDIEESPIKVAKAD